MEERLRILKMLEVGKISAEEAERLLSALEPPSSAQSLPSKKRGIRWFRIRVVDDEETVNIRMPWAFIRWAIHLVPSKVQTKLNGHDIDLRELLRTLEQEGFEAGEILDLESTDGTQVKIWVE